MGVALVEAQHTATTFTYSFTRMAISQTVECDIVHCESNAILITLALPAVRIRRSAYVDEIGFQPALSPVTW